MRIQKSSTILTPCVFFLALFASGCGKSDSAPQASTTAPATATNSNQDQTRDLLGDLKGFQDIEKDMRAYGIDVEENWRNNGGRVEPATRINLEDRSGRGDGAVEQQISILRQYIAKGQAVEARYHDAFAAADSAGPSSNNVTDEVAAARAGFSSAAAFAHTMIKTRLRLADQAIEKLERESRPRESSQNHRA